MHSTSKKLIVSLLFLFFGIQTYAQNKFSDADSSSVVNKKMLITAISTEAAVYISSMAYLRYVWYNDVERVPFHFYNDNLGYLQIDKFGHAYGAYLESEICYSWLRNANVSKSKALIYGATMGIVLQFPIEVFDGLYKGWGFSWGDVAANSAGSLFLISQELIFDQQVIDFKFSFQRSTYASLANGMLGDNTLESLFYDYNGHSYWLSTNLNRIVPISNIPSWLNLAAGYSANGMFGEFENKKTWHNQALPETERYRQFLISLDIDWNQIKTDKYFLQQLFKAVNHIKFPMPTLEYNSLNKWKFHLFYF